MRLEYHKSFKKRFKKLGPEIREQFRKRAELFVRDKFNKQLNNHAVEAAYPGCRSINITGDYRAIFHDQGDVVTFVTIGTHSDLYS